LWQEAEKDDILHISLVVLKKVARSILLCTLIDGCVLPRNTKFLPETHTSTDLAKLTSRQAMNWLRAILGPIATLHGKNKKVTQKSSRSQKLGMLLL